MQTLSRELSVAEHELSAALDDLQEAQKSAEQLRDESTAELDTGGILMAQKLRPYQQRAKDKSPCRMESGHRRTLLVLPTGTGKTIVFASVAADQVRAGGPGTDPGPPGRAAGAVGR